MSEDRPGTLEWYVVHTYSGYENKVKDNLEKAVENNGMQNLIQEVVVPTEEVVEIRNGKRVTSQHKTFPGYVLVRMIITNESWYVVRNIRGVTGFVGEANKAIPLSDAEVAALGVERHEIEVSYQVGDTVRIVDGPLTSFNGRVDALDIDKNSVRVIVSMFGRETPIELEIDQVESISE